MKYSTLATVTALVVGIAASANAQTVQSLSVSALPANVAAASAPGASNAYEQVGSNAASLNALLAEWDQAGFNPPSKPSQYRVYGRNGYVTSGPGYNAMVTLIRSAVRDARQGRDQDAAAHIAEARSMLASITPATPAHAHG
jgi:hypothetical protein